MVVVVGAGAAAAGCATRSVTEVSRPVRSAPAIGVVGAPAPAGSATLTAVACGSPERCWAVGDPPAGQLTSPAAPSTAVIDATSDGGSSWTLEHLAVSGPTSLSAISCPGPTSCMAVGSVDSGTTTIGAVLVTTNAGSTWPPVGPPAGSADVPAVACSSANQCLVLASDGPAAWSASTTDGGQVWQRGGNLPTGFVSSGSLSCSGATECVAVGYTATAAGQGAGAVATTDDGGASWVSGNLPAGVGLLHGVTCTASMACTAVGTASTATADVVQSDGQVLTSADGGRTWSLLPSLTGLEDPFSVACTTSGACVAVGIEWTRSSPPAPVGGAVIATAAGGPWSVPPIRYLPSQLTSVVCEAAASCVAVGHDVVARAVLFSPSLRPAAHAKRH
jgi:photosystem II stability/assembly factor-like uncharacterized protein